MSWDLKVQDQEVQRRENMLRKKFGDDYKPPYIAFYDADERHPRLKIFNEKWAGKECGFIMQYMHIDPVEFTGSSVLTLNYKHEVIIVKGHNLDDIINGIQDESIKFLRVFDDDLYRNELEDHQGFIESITRKSMKP